MQASGDDLRWIEPKAFGEGKRPESGNFLGRPAGYVFAEAVGACERAQSSTPFKWNGGKNTSIVGLNSVRLDKYTVIASYTLVADSVYCDYDPIKKKADVGSNFLERD